MGREEFTIAAVYDTETTNMYAGVDSRAFPCLFIVNDIRGVDISDYETGRDDNIKFFRYENEMLDYISSLIVWGSETNRVPIIAAYNLMFDLQPLMEKIAGLYKVKVTAQSSTHVYVLDLVDDEDKILLRFWETWYLEMRGLSAMGETCGLPKAVGDWDYSLIRTPETYLTKEEMFYAGRDTQVIPAYLKYLLHSNDWLKQSDFGVTVLTKTSLVRQLAKHKIGNIRYSKNNGKSITQTKMFNMLCMEEMPYSFKCYGLRKACFRGGLTFTSARYAGVVVKNVASLDVTSMHHAFINGRYVPTKFKPANDKLLENAYNHIVNQVTIVDVLENYHRPFNVAFHMQIRLDNIRLKSDSCFEKWGIAILPSAKFRLKAERMLNDDAVNEANMYAETMNRLSGYVDRVENGVFAFGKLYKADSITIYVSEVELFALTRVYEWDSHKCIFGEVTQKFDRPPDYVTLQSNLLFGMKTDVKNILKKYHKGTSYEDDIPDTIPDGLAFQIRHGAISEHFLESYYVHTVKGQFNSIYGTMAQDIYKPDFMVENDGEVHVDKDTQVTESNWEDMQPDYSKVLYTYGLRIVGGSRLHLIIAMELLYKAFGDSVIVTGGDTDSMKVSCEESITDDDLLRALEPLHTAITRAISLTMERVREEYPQYASNLKNIGCFEVESCGTAKRYKLHMEAWNKARISIDSDNKVHLTCAGLPRPDGMYTIENFANDMLLSYPPEKVLPLCLGYNEFVKPCLSFSLETHHPKTTDVFDSWVTDYRGIKRHVVAHESNALYAAARVLGDLNKSVNRDSITYVMNEYNRNIDDREKILDLDKEGNPCIYIDGNLYMKGVRHFE